MTFESTFYELAVLLCFAAIVGFVGRFLRQPLIVSFIAAGILAGPSVLDIVKSPEQLDVLAEIGISLLLFVVGLKLDLHLIRTTGTVALTTGLGQVLFTSVFGYVLCVWLGLDALTSVYVAVALTFSSTIIIVKLLSDKGEIDSLHGRVALGFLIVQDIVVVVVMIVLSAFGMGAQAETSMTTTLVLVLLQGFALLGVVGLFMRYAATPLLHRMASSPELMVLFAVSLAVSLAAGSDAMGFSKEMGAFLAGIALASTPYRDIIGARLMSLRDFLLLFFFLGLGAHMDLGTIGDQIGDALVLSVFVLVGNPLIVMIIMGVMGYRKRTGLLAGLTVAQISEFSLVFAALGFSLGHISASTVGLVTLVGLITIGLSTYMILYSQRLFAWLEPWLGVFERRIPHRERIGTVAADEHYDAIVFGLGRFGGNIARGLRQRGLSVLGIDFDPEIVRTWQDQGHPALYGDAKDPEFPSTLPLHTEQWIVSTIPPRPGGLTESDSVLTLLRALQDQGYGGRVAVTAQRAHDVAPLKHAGAHLVLLPFADAARRAVEEITGSDPAHHHLHGEHAGTPLDSDAASR